MGGASGLDILSQSGLQQSGIGDYSGSLANNRTVWPAIVVPFGTNDNSEQNRIRVRIVKLDENGNIVGKMSSNDENYNNYAGKDQNIPDNKLVICVPLLPEFFHVRPQVGEMVFVIMENSKENSGTRYWIGPIITSKLKLNGQLYEESVKIFNETTFISNRKIESSQELMSIFPQDSDVAIQGRNDADLILKNRETLLIAGKLNRENFIINTETPSYLRLKQVDQINKTEIKESPKKITHNINTFLEIDTNGRFVGTIVITELKTNFQLKNDKNSYSVRKMTIDWLDSEIKAAKEKYKTWSFTTTIQEYKNLPANYNIKATPTATTPPSTTNNQDLLTKFSQATLVSTSINMYSPRGKFRGNDLKPFEKNKDLKSFGDFSDSLHPSIFGDEAVRLFDLIIRLLLTHSHHPQKPLLQTSISDELKKYTVDGWLQNLLSNHVRIN